MSIGLGIILVLLLAAGFVAFPFISRRIAGSGNNSQAQQANIDIFRDQQRQYRQQLDSGEINQPQYAAMIAEAEQLLLSNTSAISSETPNQSAAQGREGLWILPLLLVVITLATLWIYSSLGASKDEQITRLLKEQGQSMTPGQAVNWNPQLIGMIGERVKQRPDNLYYWTILAQEAVSRGDMASGANYFAESVRISPRDGYLLAQYAQALFFADGNKFTQRVVTAVDNAFAVDSSNQTVLGLKGIEAFENRDYKLAISYWQAAAQQLDPASSDWQALQNGIQKARQLLGDSADPLLSVSLSIDSGVEFSPQQLVFVAVVQADGPPMPIVARKLTASQLPLQIQLSDDDALMEGRTLTGAGSVRVVARLSKSGSATPQVGDWEAISETLDIRSETQPVILNISRQRTQ